jgi:hypothetical protein
MTARQVSSSIKMHIKNVNLWLKTNLILGPGIAEVSHKNDKRMST